MVIFYIRNLVSAIYAITLSQYYKDEDKCFLVIHQGNDLSTISDFIKSYGNNHVYDLNITSHNILSYFDHNIFNNFKSLFNHVSSIKTAYNVLPENIKNRKVKMAFYCGGPSNKLPFKWLDKKIFFYYEHGIGNTLDIVSESLCPSSTPKTFLRIIKSNVKLLLVYSFKILTGIENVNISTYSKYYSFYSEEFNGLIKNKGNNNLLFENIDVAIVKRIFGEYYNYIKKQEVILPKTNGESVDIFILPPIKSYMKIVINQLKGVKLSNVAIVKPHPSYSLNQNYIYLNSELKKFYKNVISLDKSNAPIEAIIGKFNVNNVIGRLSTGLFNICKMYKNINIIIILPTTIETTSPFSSFTTSVPEIIDQAFSDSLKIIFVKN